MYKEEAATAGANSLGRYTVKAIFKRGARREGPRVRGGVSRGEGVTREGADASADGEADMDMHCARARDRADGEARHDNKGEVGDPESARGADRGMVEGGGEGEGGTGGEAFPGLFPVNEVAMLGEPLLNAWVEYDETIIKLLCEAARVGRAVSEEAMEE